MILRTKSRAEAVASGEIRYFTGVPCGRGHISERKVSDHSCLMCKNEDRKEFNKKFPERVSAANKKQYLKNREANIARSAKRAKELPEANRANARRYYAEHQEKYAVHSRNRKARVRMAEGSHSAVEIAEMMVKQKGKCLNCGTDITKACHADHIIPLIKGGSNWISNIQLLCPFCNLSKKDKDPIEWAKSNGRLV